MLRPGFGTLHMSVRAQRNASHRSKVTLECSSAKSLIICTNPRSGSWLLSEGLAATGAAGNPREWFNPFHQQRWRALWRMRSESDLNFAQYLQLVRRRSRSRNGVSGIKLHAYQLRYLPQFHSHGANAERSSPAQSLRKLFPGVRRYIWLTRRDRVRQAISLELAFATNRWWSLNGEAASGAPEGAPVFDPTAIAQWEVALTAYDARWADFFRSNAIMPVTLVYEDLVADYEGSIRSILQLLDVPNAETAAVPPARLRRQSDALSETWLAQYQTFRASGAFAALRCPSIDAEDPIEARCINFRAAIPPLWRRWITYGRLLHLNGDALAAVLISNGYDPVAARAAVEANLSEAASVGFDDLATVEPNLQPEMKVRQL